MKNLIKCPNLRKGAVIGCGFVGSAIAYSLMQSGIFSELVLIDIDKERAEGEALDIGHGIPFSRQAKIYAGDYDDISDASVIIITAGANQAPGETRLDLVHKNIAVFKKIIPEISRLNFAGVLLIVTNPVDIMTNAAIRISGFDAHRVIGSGTVLDSARLKYHLSEDLEIDSRSIHAFIIGEHGDSEFAVWSSASISGLPLDDFFDMRSMKDRQKYMHDIEQEVRNSAYEIIKRKQATYYGIASAVSRICTAVIRDEKSILPVSSMMRGCYGISDLVLSMPSIVGLNGSEGTVPISLDDSETEKLLASAKTLARVTDEAIK